MKIDDILNSNDAPIEKAKQAIELFEKSAKWIDSQEEVKEEHLKMFNHTLDITNIICSNISVDELYELLREDKDDN